MVSTMTNSETVTIPAGYKQTEVGVVPEDWIIEPLINLCAVIDGDRGSNYPSSNDFFPDGYCVFLSATNVTKKGFKFNEVSFISKEKDDLLRKGKLKRGDVVLTTRGSVGHFSYYDESVSFENLRINSGMVLIRNETEKFSNDYLSTLLNSPIIKNQIETMSFGSAQPQLTVRDINSFYLCFPIDKSEQTAIANALSDVDKLIAALETLIAKKSAIKTAAMQQLLTGKKRLPAFAGEREGQHLKANEQCNAKSNEQHRTQPNSASDTPSQHHSDAENKQHTPRPGYKHTELGEIPEDWEVKALGSIGESIIGLTYSPNDVADFGSLVLRSSNVQKNRLAFENNVFVNMELPDRVIVRENDILVCVRNGSRQLIGKCALIDDKTAGSAFGAFMSIYRTEFSKFVFFQFQSNIIQNQINEVMGATINQITNKDMAGFKIPLPKDTKEQTAIANVLSDMDTELDALHQRLEKIQSIKQGMMQELLTGKTRLIKPLGEVVHE